MTPGSLLLRSDSWTAVDSRTPAQPPPKGNITGPAFASESAAFVAQAAQDALWRGGTATQTFSRDAAGSVHAAPACGGAAVAVDLLAAERELIVILELLTNLQVALRVHDNVLVVGAFAHLKDLGEAVGRARVVHEARHISRHGGVDVERLIDAEDVAVAGNAEARVLVEEAVGQGRADEEALVLDEHFPFGDGLLHEEAPSMDTRPTHLEALSRTAVQVLELLDVARGQRLALQVLAVLPLLERRLRGALFGSAPWPAARALVLNCCQRARAPFERLGARASGGVDAHELGVLGDLSLFTVEGELHRLDVPPKEVGRSKRVCRPRGERSRLALVQSL
eukprot:CAMPEP_0119359720 /NCGR_PEP_ID=MMETSP1334-20130426/7539_1 /TAXON_ID=127549 /ORGANISM="Calcidiscus leptoporus, Strain RCC1130" /LENGTH=337 /DNA_ID=CAMNT_0007374439 /DNA_START=284 /DNA_END=1295 /DNA_ORIENTATION=+